MRLFASLLIGFWLTAGSAPPLHADEDRQLTAFAAAHTLYIQGQNAGAKDLFQQTLSEKFTLSDYSLFYLANIAFAEKAWDEFRRLASRLTREFPQSVWAHTAELQMAKADLAENKLAEAVAALRSLRSKPVANTEMIEEALFLEAQATGDAKRAHEVYQQLREQYPNSKWTPVARREQAALRETQPDIFPFQTVESLIAEAEQLVRERAYGEAEVMYKRLLNNAEGAADLRLRLLNKLSGLYIATRRRADAMPVLEQIAGDYPETPEAAKALYQIGQILWNRHENTRALAVFQQLITHYPASSELDRAFYAAADIQEWLGNKDEAAALYRSVRLQFPQSQARDDATWRLAWLHYRSGELPEAYRAFKLVASETRQSALKTAAHYWQGRAAEKAGDRELAKQVYREVYDGSEESYYQALAARALAKLGATVRERHFERPAPGGGAVPPAIPLVAFHLQRARALSRLELYGLAVAEIAAIERIAGADNKTRLFLSREYFNNQAYRRSLALATQLPASEAERDLYRFPLAHWTTIKEKAQESRVDPYLVVALIRQESLFDPRARSPAFAIGLMQLLPSTAARVASRIGMPAPSDEKLFDPEVNITLGTYYLKDLLKRYSNNWFKAIAAYNAGEAAVDRWEKEIATDDNEEFVERIPYLETRGYVKLVLRNHRIYKRLYEQKK
jgi:soluble lytic murein transglycosylase